MPRPKIVRHTTIKYINGEVCECYPLDARGKLIDPSFNVRAKPIKQNNRVAKETTNKRAILNTVQAPNIDQESDDSDDGSHNDIFNLDDCYNFNFNDDSYFTYN